MGSRDRFPPRRPPREAVGGTPARSRRGDIGEQWWSRRFVAALERIGERGRLSRGRSYARSGQVMDLDIGPGLVTALVQGTRPRPYEVSIEIDVFTDEQWDRIENAMAQQALFLAALLAGEMPEEIEQAFDAAGFPLFPLRMFDLRPYCSCPDAGNPCKHAAATLYILAERFDEDPFQIFAWRGRTEHELARSLRRRRTAFDPRPPGGAAVAGDDATAVDPINPDPVGFWRAGPELGRLALSPRAPTAPENVLRQLEPLPLSAGDVPLIDALTRAYRTVTRNAERIAYDQE
ncbi:MAG: hypothetical protein GEU90_19200 [Gemmatimonas sp.]|nr:hypothetical protein [Gemmatimonas sp.]